jgi:hypothetical protein
MSGVREAHTRVAHHGRARLVALVAAVAAAACGPSPVGEATLHLDTRDAAIFAEADTLALYLYGAARKTGGCRALVVTSPRPPSSVGPFAVTIDATARAEGLRFPLDALPVDRYTLLADAVVTSTVIATACQGDVDVTDGARATVTLTLVRR